MALVTISGLPSSGKTRRARQLQNLLREEQSLPVEIINDESLGLSKSDYDDARAEKSARGVLTGGVQRTLRKDRIVICDALNYIKGFRYQLYVLARELGCRVVTIHVASPPAKCREWNQQRDQAQRYSDQTMEDLLSRYEEPSYAVRWDTPLVVVPYTDDDLPKLPILEAVLHGALKPPTTAAAPRVVSSTDYLRRIDSATTSVIAAFLSAQALQPGGPIAMRLGDLSTVIQGPADGRTVTAPTLQRHKRAFVALTKQMSAREELDEARLATLFADYLNEQLTPKG